MHKPSSLRDYGIAALFGVCFFVLLLAYLIVRQGNPETFGLNAESQRLFNLAFAGAGTLLIGLAFLVGPLSRYFNAFDSWIQYRKEFGILGALAAFAHGYLSLASQLARGGIDLLARNGALLWGVLGAILLLFLVLLSYKKIIALFGGRTWWFLQRWGIRLVVLLTVLHVLALRFSGWQRWYREETTLPPTGLLIGLVLAWVVGIRIFEAVFVFRSFGWQTRELSPESPELRRGRRFFNGSLFVFLLVIGWLVLR